MGYDEICQCKILAVLSVRGADEVLMHSAEPLL